MNTQIDTSRLEPIESDGATQTYLDRQTKLYAILFNAIDEYWLYICEDLTDESRELCNLKVAVADVDRWQEIAIEAIDKLPPKAIVSDGQLPLDLGGSLTP